MKSNTKVVVAAALIGEKLEAVVADGKYPVQLVGLEFARLKEVETAAKDLTTSAPKANPTSKVGQALSKLRKLMKIDGPQDGIARELSSLWLNSFDQEWSRCR